METITIDVPEKKLPLVKLFLAELGIAIRDNDKSSQLAVKADETQIASSKKLADFFGILSKEEGEKFDKHVNKIRKEWDRNI